MDNRGIETVEIVIKLTDGTEFIIRTGPYDPALNGHHIIVEDLQNHGGPNVSSESCGDFDGTLLYVVRAIFARS